MRSLWIAAMLGVVGCGLADYEKRMDEKREYLRNFDEEATLLADPIDMPSGKDAYGKEIKVPFEIFLRPPRGVVSVCKGPEGVYYGDKVRLFRYSHKTDVNVLAAWTNVAETKLDTKVADDELTPEDFRKSVRKALLDYIARSYSVTANPPDFAQLKTDPRQTIREGKPATITLEAAVFDDPRVQNPSRYYVYFLPLKYRQAAVIYQVPVKEADPTFQRTMDVSLKTLEISGSAATMRNAFRSRK